MPQSPDAARRWWVRGAITAALIAAAALLRFTVFAPDPILVQVTQADRGRVEATVTNSKAGTLRSRKRSRVSAETGGRVVAILHREGDLVKQGELLIRLNDDHLVAQVELSQAGLKVGEARHREACLNRDFAYRELKRAKQLAESRVVAEDQIDRFAVTA
jgi:HlyD family secretion protein